MENESGFEKIRVARKLKIMGLDASLTGTGVALFTHNRGDGDVILNEIHLISTLPTVARVLRFPRFYSIVDEIEKFVVNHGVDIVVIEGYALQAKGRAAADLPELGGMIRMMLKINGIPFLEVEPPSLKKHIHGKGNASKEEMIEAVNTLMNTSVTDDNVADAMGLGVMLIHRLKTFDYNLHAIIESLVDRGVEIKEEKRLKKLRKKYGKNIPEDKLNPKPKKTRKEPPPPMSVTKLDF